MGGGVSGLLTAVVLGMAVAAPPGPVSALCVGRTVRGGFSRGLATGIGAALGDACYAALAAAGVAVVVGDTIRASTVPVLVAAALLAAGGVRLLARVRRGASDGDAADSAVASPAACVLSGLLLTLVAPGTLPAFVALLALFGDLGPGGGGRVASVTTGVACGATLWWVAVCSLTLRIRGRSAHVLAVLDTVSGVLLLCAAVAAVRVALG